MQTLNQTEMNNLALALNSSNFQNDSEIQLTKNQIEERQLIKIRQNVLKYVEDTKAMGFSVSEVIERYVESLVKA